MGNVERGCPWVDHTPGRRIGQDGLFGHPDPAAVGPWRAGGGPATPSTLKVIFREIQETLPVERLNRVPALADVIPDIGADDGLADRR